MFKEYKIKQTSSQKRGRLTSDFELLPQNPVPPVIKSQPIKNFLQYTHTNTNNELIPVKPVNESLIKVIKGTTIGFSVIVENSSNVIDPYNIDSLKFVWKQNDSEIYALTNLNNGKGTPYVYLEGVNTTPEINGEYYVEVTNEYGTTVSEVFTIEVLDPDTNILLNKNLIKNGNGNKGLSDWELSDDIKVYQFEESVNWTFNYASLYDENRQTDKARTVGELPFNYCSGDNGASFKSFWDRVAKSSSLDSYSKWVYAYRAPNIVVNEDSSYRYAQMYPSPQSVDRYNLNNRTNKQGLVDSFNVLPTYFGRDKIRFQRVGGQRDSYMTQVIDITDISDIVDGSVVGAKSLQAQFFGYFGNGITKYNYVLYKKDSAGKEVVDRVLNTYIVDSKSFSAMLKVQSFQKLEIPTYITRIDLVPVTDDQSDVTIQCLDQSDIVLKELTIKGPDNRDVFAVKERFFISAFVNKIFNAVTDFYGRNIPVTIFGQKYFEITTDLKRNKNQQWLAKNYPKGKYDVWDNGNFTLTGFDKGAAAMFGLGENFTIPPKTRSLKVVVKFTHNSKAFTDDSPSTADWIYDDIYAEHLKDGAWYEYNNPRVGATQIKLLLGVNGIVKGLSYPTYYIQPSHVWKANKDYLSKNIHDETAKVVYNFTDGKSTEVVLADTNISQTTLAQFQNTTNAGYLPEIKVV